MHSHRPRDRRGFVPRAPQLLSRLSAEPSMRRPLPHGDESTIVTAPSSPSDCRKTTELPTKPNRSALSARSNPKRRQTCSIR